MRNIWFTIYSSNKDDHKYYGLANYRTLLEILLIPVIQNKINRDKKVQKIMFCLISDLEKDLIDNFRNNYYNKKVVTGGIINLDTSTKNIDWNNLSEAERKDFLIEKWKVLFNNLSNDYFVTDKSEVIDALEKLKGEEWKISNSLFKKKLKYKEEVYDIVMDLSTKKAELALVRVSDEKRINLKDYETWKIMTDANFKKFKLEGDILTFENSSIFGMPETFDLKEFIK